MAKHCSEYQVAAISAGQWLVQTQITDSLDANRGRFIYARNLDSGYTELSTGWQTGFAVMGLLSLHRLTGDAQYLNSADMGVDYLRSLQILDGRDCHLLGAFREETPQTNWLHPRDALSAAWGLLYYGQYTQDQDCLERARLFADWMLAYAFCGDWPICTFQLGAGGLGMDDLQGSFQSGGILFFHELFEATGDIRYHEIALRMSDYYVEHFISQQGQLEILIDPLGNNPGVHDTEKWPTDWQDMHRVNDDFGGLSLVRSYRVFKQEKYRQRLDAFVKVMLSWQKATGGFLDPEMEVGSATVPILLHHYRHLVPTDGRAELDDATTRALNHLLTFQQQSEDPMVNGAFLGMNNRCRGGQGRWINIRCTTYAILALLMPSKHSVFPMPTVEK